MVLETRALPNRRRRLSVLVSAAVVLTLTIGFGFVLRTRATELEANEELTLNLRSQLHQSDAALLSVLVTGEIMPARRNDLMGSVAELNRLALEAVDAGVAPSELIDEIEFFSSGAFETLQGVDEGVSLDGLITIHDESIVVAFLATSEIVDDTVARIAAESARNRMMADIGALAELLVVALAVAATVSWLRRLSSAEEAMGEKDRFIATVSHELRTPLTGVVGMAELLREVPDLGDDASELVEIIAQQGREVSYLVEDLLIAGRDQMSDLSIVNKPMDALREAQAAIRAVGGPTASQVRCTAQGDAHVVSDPLRFRQIVRNLVANAIKHGGSEIRVDMAHRGRWLLLAVSDVGPRLSDADAVAIFEPYTRSPGRTVTGSVGLGLPVSRMLADRLGGDLSYSHAHGRNVFALKVPAGTSGIETPAETGKSELSPATG
jgi:signal transduction histidine kinase